MPRRCTICAHESRTEIDRALVARQPYRAIACRYGVGRESLRRHEEHLPETLALAEKARETAHADDLLAQIRALQGATFRTLEKAESAEDWAVLLRAVREGRENAETLGKLLGRLDERPQVNIVMNPQWLELRTVIISALEPHEAAREAVLRALEQGGGEDVRA
ncbi:MAG: hypothetical protein M3Q60_21885 [Actinomycetota bacterium]|nr:hypothetical protein [Actinomycetota bacterium]